MSSEENVVANLGNDKRQAILDPTDEWAPEFQGRRPTARRAPARAFSVKGRKRFHERLITQRQRGVDVQRFGLDPRQ